MCSHNQVAAERATLGFGKECVAEEKRELQMSFKPYKCVHMNWSSSSEKKESSSVWESRKLLPA